MNLQSKRNLLLISHINVVSLIGCIVVVILTSSGDYFRFGYSDNLVVMGIKIDTAIKYLLLCLAIVIIKTFTQYRQSIVYPWIQNTIYDHKTTEMSEWSIISAQYVANSNYIADSLFYIFLINVYISQFDIALLMCIVVELTNLYTIHRYLAIKKWESHRDRSIKNDEKINLV